MTLMTSLRLARHTSTEKRVRRAPGRILRAQERDREFTRLASSTRREAVEAWARAKRNGR